MQKAEFRTCLQKKKIKNPEVIVIILPFTNDGHCLSFPLGSKSQSHRVNVTFKGFFSFQDVLAGIILECAIICIILPCMKELAMEKWCQTSQNALYTAFILPSMLLLIYPTSTPITFNTYADTAMVLGIFAGSVVGLRFSAGNENLMLEFLARTSGMSGYELYGLYMLRFAIGTIILALTRATMKWCVTSSFSKIVPSFMITKPLGYKRFVEIPHKIITYGMVAFNCIYITPKVFKLGGI